MPGLRRPPESSAAPAVVLFTLGYEGLRLADWLARLRVHAVAAVCDVRRNPVSRKPGFSCRQLEAALRQAGIAYVPFPELGIASAERAAANTRKARQTLFRRYRRGLARRAGELERLAQTAEEHRRVALVCFEARPEDCHRHCLSETLAGEHGWTVRHL